MGLSTYIENDLEARIRSGDDLPEKLTLTELSAHYNVSLTPVRAAVDALVDRRLLIRTANGRIEINPRKAGRGSAPAAKPPAERDERIRQDVLRLSLQGEEVFLREQAAAERYGIGRTALRGVLSRLANAGLIEHMPHRGWRIRPFRAGDMTDYLAVRRTLEVQALDLAKDRLDPGFLQEVHDQNVSEWRGQPAQLDNRLHAHWIDRCGNQYLQDFFRRHGPYFTALFEFAAPGAKMVTEMVQQHRGILSALLKKDWAAARRLLGEHIADQAPVTERLIQQLKDRDTDDAAA